MLRTQIDRGLIAMRADEPSWGHTPSRYAVLLAKCENHTAAPDSLPKKCQGTYVPH